jgi:hypothetical protein
VALLKSFDAPVMQVNCECRPTSTVATQALMLMNSQFILKHAGQLAERIRQEAAEVKPPELEFDPMQVHNPFDGPRGERPALPRQVIRAWQLTYGRVPTDGELHSALDFLVEQTRYLRANREAHQGTRATTQAITNLCQVLLSSNEFLYID